MNRPIGVYLGQADPTTPQLAPPRNPATFLTRDNRVKSLGYLAAPSVSRTYARCLGCGGESERSSHGGDRWVLGGLPDKVEAGRAL